MKIKMSDAMVKRMGHASMGRDGQMRLWYESKYRRTDEALVALGMIDSDRFLTPRGLELLAIMMFSDALADWLYKHRDLPQQRACNAVATFGFVPAWRAAQDIYCSLSRRELSILRSEQERARHGYRTNDTVVREGRDALCLSPADWSAKGVGYNETIEYQFRKAFDWLLFEAEEEAIEAEREREEARIAEELEHSRRAHVELEGLQDLASSEVVAQ